MFKFSFTPSSALVAKIFERTGKPAPVKLTFEVEEVGEADRKTLLELKPLMYGGILDLVAGEANVKAIVTNHKYRGATSDFFAEHETLEEVMRDLDKAIADAKAKTAEFEEEIKRAEEAQEKDSTKKRAIVQAFLEMTDEDILAKRIPFYYHEAIGTNAPSIDPDGIWKRATDKVDRLKKVQAEIKRAEEAAAEQRFVEWGQKNGSQYLRDLIAAGLNFDAPLRDEYIESVAPEGYTESREETVTMASIAPSREQLAALKEAQRILPTAHLVFIKEDQVPAIEANLEFPDGKDFWIIKPL